MGSSTKAAPCAMTEPSATATPPPEMNPSVDEVSPCVVKDLLAEETPSSGAKPSTPPAKEPSAGATPTKVRLTKEKPSTENLKPSHRYILGVPDPNGALLFMVLVSVLYALLAPWLLWRVTGQATTFVWTASLLSCSYFFIGTIRLSQKMGFFAIFFRISYVALLSVAATYFVGPNSGATVAILLTLYAAGMFGYAIAEYLQLEGSEDPAIAVVTPPSRVKYDDESVLYFLFMHGIMSLSFLVRIVWLVLRPSSAIFLVAAADRVNEALFVVEELSLETLIIAWPCSAFVAVVLQKEVIVSLSTMLYKIPACVGMLYTLGTVFSVAVGKIAVVLTLWPSSMAMVGLFGYVLAMFARCKKIQASISILSEDTSKEQDQQPMVQNVIDDDPDRKVAPSL